MVDNNTNLVTHEKDDIINPDMDKREFKITVGIRSYWITKEELEKYLKERKLPGVDLVAIRGGLLFLPAQCQEIVHRSVIEDSQKIDSGRWQCEAGSWHKDGTTCYCNVEFVETEEGLMRLQEKTDKPLLVGERQTPTSAGDFKSYAGRDKAFSYKQIVPIKTF